MEYEIIRTKRKTISVQITPENRIIVRCPNQTPISKIEDFLSSKKGWIQKVLYQNKVKLSENEDILNYRQVYINGFKVPLIISDKNAVTSEGVYLTDIKKLKKVFTSKFLTEFLAFVKEISESTGLSTKNYFVRSYKSRWGCCDRAGTITFNFLIFMLPQELQRYIIVHEMCHTVYFNHSKLFWQLVGKIEPDYKKLRMRLKNFDFLTRLY